MADTFPAFDHEIVAAYEAPDGSVYVHADLSGRVQPWSLSETFGDLESWIAYVKEFSGVSPKLLTWNEQGFKAKLGYKTERSNAGTWEASYPFEPTPQWADWQRFATNHGVAHKSAVEFLEDHAPDIVEPDATALLAILRNLRANVNTNATAELRADGTTHITFEKNQRVATPTEIDLPPQFEIGVPVLAGDPNIWKLVVRLRVSVTADNHLELRFAMPQAVTVLETVYGERVAAARQALGDGFTVLRAAGY